MTTFVPLPRKYEPDVVAPANVFIAPCAVVLPEPPLATATVPVTLDAVPVVFWFKVGNVQFAKLPEVGVPKIGVTNDGVFASTTAPEPVEVVEPEPPLATGKVPVT